MKRTLRLCLAYLGIIMAVSIFFSAIIYYVTVGEADRGLQRQVQGLKPNLYFLKPDALDKVRQDQLSSYRHRVVTRLIFVNTGMLALGAGVSYILARRHLEPLEDALEAQARFTSDAAHELRTPLTAIKTETEVGLRDKNLQLAEAKELLNSNLEEVAKLETLTNALLRLAKSGNKPDKTSWKRLTYKKLVQEAVERVLPAARAAKISFDTKGLGNEKVRGDHDQLVELVVVLLDNAIKYGRPDTTVTIKSQNRKHRAELMVADQGIGMKQSDLPHIFERFYRADQSRTKQTVGGMGLGLSLAQQIAEAHDGRIKVASEIDKGTTFTVVLPEYVPVSTASA